MIALSDIRNRADPAMKHPAGPAIHAVHPWIPGNRDGGTRHQLLSEDERAQLAKIATIVRFDKGGEIYAEGAAADAAFNIISGVVVAHRSLEGAEHVISFLYPGDLFGLSEEGRYAKCDKSHDSGYGLQDTAGRNPSHPGQ